MAETRLGRKEMLRNLTAHAVNLPGGTISAEAQPARCDEAVVRAGSIAGVPVVAKRFGEITGLPAPEAGTYLIVSAIVARAAWAAGRRDVVTVGDPIRDADGRIVGAGSLCVCPDPAADHIDFDGYRAEALYRPPMPAIMSGEDTMAGADEPLAEVSIPARPAAWTLRLYDDCGNVIAERPGWSDSRGLRQWADAILSSRDEEDYM